MYATESKPCRTPPAALRRLLADVYTLLNAVGIQLTFALAFAVEAAKVSVIALLRIVWNEFKPPTAA
jgi:hypothetical protein